MDQVHPSVLVIDPDTASRNYLSVMLRKAGYAVFVAPAGREGLISAWTDEPAVVIFDPALPDMKGADLVKRLRQDRRTESVPCVALGSQQNLEEMSEVLSAGCNEYLVKSSQVIQKLVELLPRLLRKESDVKQGGRSIVFLSAKGGTGTSSLCANIAMCLGRSKPDTRLAVVDMVLPIGSIANIVGYTGPMNLVSVAMQSAEQTTPHFFREELPRINDWYFRLLAGSPDPEAANQLAGGRIADIIAGVQESYDYLFVDLGRSLSRLSLPIIQHADAIVLILGTEMAAVTLTQTIWEYLRAQGVASQRVYAILNRAVGLEGLTKSEAEQMLGLQIRFTMPYMGGNFSLANNRHEPVAVKFPTDAAALTLVQMSEQIAELAQRSRG
jgi:MinD-like ATPase involved in chromosome partitioning or flagellar assembly/CheY-like chemotaxis protein